MLKKLPKLDARLAVIAGMVREGVRCADIGTDHGHLIAWLAASGRISAGYASDINQKPLDKAAFALSAYGVEKLVKLELCDGLSGLADWKADDIIIAGMGGELIWELISAQGWTRNSSLRFLLQPMTRAEQLRTALYLNGFVILQEQAVVSGDFPYTVMQATYTGESVEIEPAFAYGGLVLDREDPASRRYLAKAARLVRERAQGKALAAGRQEILAKEQAVLDRLEGGYAE